MNIINIYYLGSDETGFESMSSTCTDEKILSEQNEEEEEPSSPLITGTCICTYV